MNNDFKIALLKSYTNGIITLEQYRVLLGLCNHGDENGAKKGLEKLERRFKREHGK